MLLEAAERNLYELELSLRCLPVSIRHTSIVGSIADPALLADIFHRYWPEDLSCRRLQARSSDGQNPFAAIHNNSLGTNVLAEAATDHGTKTRHGLHQ